MRRFYGTLAMAAMLAVPVGRVALTRHDTPMPVAAAVYTARPGDTLWSIARHLNPTGDTRVCVGRLMRLNGSSSVSVYPGQSLRLPSC